MGGMCEWEVCGGEAWEVRGDAGSANLASLEGAVDSPSVCRRRVLACKEESPSDIATKGVRDGVLRSTCHDKKIGSAQGKVGERHSQRRQRWGRQRWVGRRTDCDIRVRALRMRIGAPSRANDLRRIRRDRDRTREDLDQIRSDLRGRCRGDAREIVSWFVRNYAHALDG
jgi:hypothetical protein